MMKDWNDLKYVVALANGGTMKHAAELIGADATTISRHIKSLSTDMGAVLFTMSRSGTWEITSEGQLLLDVGLQMQSNIEALNQNGHISDELKTVKITSLEFLLTHYVAPQVGNFYRTVDDIKLELHGSDKRLSLAYAEADLALRFGRPTEGQLVASKVADIPHFIWSADQSKTRDWIGLNEHLDWTPEMQMGFTYFDKEPVLRVTSFAAARRASLSLGIPFIAPKILIQDGDPFERLHRTEGANREIWSVIHETKRHSQTLALVKEWIKGVFAQQQVPCGTLL